MSKPIIIEDDGAPQRRFHEVEPVSQWNLGQFIDALKVAPADAEAARDKSWEDMDVLDNKDFRERLSAIETNVERTNRLLEAALHPMTKN